MTDWRNACNGACDGEFIKYTKEKQGVVFMRKDDIARMVMNDPILRLITVKQSSIINKLIFKLK
jgi:hypothetical protein